MNNKNFFYVQATKRKNLINEFKGCAFPDFKTYCHKLGYKNIPKDPFEAFSTGIHGYYGTPEHKRYERLHNQYFNDCTKSINDWAHGELKKDKVFGTAKTKHTPMTNAKIKRRTGQRITFK